MRYVGYTLIDMSKETSVCVVGAVVFFVPFMGLPREYKEWILIVAGILLMILGYGLRRMAFFRSIEDGNGGKQGDVFKESGAVSHSTQIADDSQKLHI